MQGLWLSKRSAAVTSVLCWCVPSTGVKGSVFSLWPLPPFPCALVPQTTQAVLCDLESSAPLVQLMQREEASPAVLTLTYTVVIHKCIAVVALLPILHDPISAGTPILQAVIHGIQRGELTRQTHSGYWTRPAAACIASKGEGFWRADPTTRFLCLCWSEVLYRVWSKVQQTQYESCC